MSLRRFFIALALCSAAVGTAACDGEPVPLDAGMDGGVDAFVPIVRTREELPDPEAFQAGVAQVRIPAPLGIGTMGFGAIGEDPNVTPFSDTFPGTRRLHGTLTFRAVALSRGDAHEVILVRMDTVGVFQQLREAVVDELEARTGRSFDESLVLAGNHTHSGPGRMLLTEGALVALGDTFFPEFYDRIVASLADVVEAALADRAPAEIGYTIAESREGHSDRRCENDSLDQPQEVPDLPMIAIRREGTIDAIVASYAYHGTILGISQLTLSGDMGAVVEQRIEERFDHPVTVLFFNSWGADMSPSNPEADPAEVGADQPGSYDRMDRLGDVIADAMMPELDAMSFDGAPTVRARTYRAALSREAIGYDDSTFRYPNGGVFCGVGAEGNCTDSAPIENLHERCIRILPRENLPQQTLFTAGQIGELYFVTAPGEWSTALGAGLMDRVRERSGGDAMMIGYANDYTGYSLTEEDWWQGGYEASGGLWGPGQGDYLAARAYEAFESYLDGWNEPPYREPAPIEPFTGYTYEPYVPETPVGVGTVTADVPAAATPTDTLTFTVQGTDPWLGAPVATLEHDEGGGTFAAVMRGNGKAIDSTSYDFWIDLTVTPSYDEALPATERAFEWTFHFPISRRAGSNVPALGGAHRFAIRIPTDMDGGEVVVHTGTFTLP